MGMPTIPQQAQLPGDAVVYGGVVAVWLGYLPTVLAIIASVLSILWLSAQLFTWIQNRRNAKKNS
jgi:hypothetical protein